MIFRPTVGITQAASENRTGVYSTRSRLGPVSFFVALVNNLLAAARRAELLRRPLLHNSALRAAAKRDWEMARFFVRVKE